MQLLSRPSIGADNGMIERFDRTTAEVAQHELTTGPKHPRELSDRCRNSRRIMVNGRVPGEDATERPIGLIDVIDALNIKSDARIGRLCARDEGRHKVDPADVEPETCQVVRPVPGAAAGVQDTSAQALGLRVDELTV